MLLLSLLILPEILHTKMVTSGNTQKKRKVTPTKQGPLNKSIKIGTEISEASIKLISMKKSELVRYCEELMLKNNELSEQNNTLIEAEKQNNLTVVNLEKTVAELKEKCSNTPVYLCSDCDYIAECIHDFNDHTHSIEDVENQDEASFNCNFCNDAFETLSDIMEHKKLIHTSNVQHCNQFLEGNCLYGNSCWFLHSETLKQSEPNIISKFCEKKFWTKASLREHMKVKHIQMVQKCKNENTCKFGPEKCWFIHPQDIENAYQTAKSVNKSDNHEI